MRLFSLSGSLLSPYIAIHRSYSSLRLAFLPTEIDTIILIVFSIGNDKERNHVARLIFRPPGRVLPPSRSSCRARSTGWRVRSTGWRVHSRIVGRARERFGGRAREQAGGCARERVGCALGSELGALEIELVGAPESEWREAASSCGSVSPVASRQFLAALDLPPRPPRVQATLYGCRCVVASSSPHASCSYCWQR